MLCTAASMGVGLAGLCPVRTAWAFKEHVSTKNHTVSHAFFIKKFSFRKEPNSSLSRNCSKYSRTTNCHHHQRMLKVRGARINAAHISCADHFFISWGVY